MSTSAMRCVEHSFYRLKTAELMEVACCTALRLTARDYLTEECVLAVSKIRLQNVKETRQIWS